ncbi:hypothetical protein O6H91_02G035600 [Diphasiastrum complanatum]|uniref:Uncharacterized protein n=9 Tax=Diphasiastrum complanatum TaxID=34168 RepID=A0ACC2E958_DIPCM|nr:hypothetical protein O6H91_03G094500 [Diphasiastrum complanatum]KAJ7563040.1 hypothetical protein O6H91_03G094500 [Diphasiastrum complanatum]KAJ7563041.1 hypothetical protein O6H91_03G094500 [Diphasiastrum complanatum]KAJ7563042.1 hypothetical protein O6H91_03G094500 [Diphasiastrum complanatum]KAJ7563043.1 hypothetical protein O6H91_03G094500 [Diphasiastrum complanatum]
MTKSTAIYLRGFLLFIITLVFEGSHKLLSQADTTSVLVTSRFKPAPEIIPEEIAVQGGPREFFEVTKPLNVPPHMTPCSMLLLKHSFADTINLPPFVTTYTPSESCGSEWEKVILKWKATCKGRQFDRISAVWLSGVEIFRTCTGEPTADGIEWKVEKDVTKFAVLFKDLQTLVVSLGNVIDKTYTGIFHITLTVDFYPRYERKGKGNSKPSKHADVVLPVSLASPLNGGYWFQLQGETDVKSVSVTVPANVYKARLEICVSFHGNDEFWYTNPTNDYIEANNLTGQIPGNGPFREVVVFIDDFVAGAVWPFPVVYTGGINPLFWRPVAAIGAFDLPSYDIDITPFVGVFADGRAHNISLRVTNSLSFWLLDANLHLWLDPNSLQVTGRLLEYKAPDLHAKSVDSYTGLDGNISTKASRSVYYSGYIFSSYGNITASSFYSYKFQNLQVYSNDANVSLVEQSIKTKSRVTTRIGSQNVDLDEIDSSYPLSVFSAQVNLPNGTIMLNASIAHALNEHVKVSKTGSSSLHNSQVADGLIFIAHNLVTSGWGALRQNYSFEGKSGCYYRSLSARNYSLLSDIVDTSCTVHDVPNCFRSPRL